MPFLLILAALLIFGWAGFFFVLAIGPLAHLILVVAAVLIVIHFASGRRGGGTVL